MQGPRWAVIADGRLTGEGLPSDLEAALEQVRARRGRVTSVALPPGSPNDWALVADGQLSTRGGVAAELVDAGEAAERGQRRVDAVAIGADGAWVLAAGGWAPSGGAPAEMRAAIDRMRIAEGRSLDQLVLRHNGGWAIYSNGRRAAAAAPDRIESDVAGQSIYQRMEAHQITGLAVSWIDGNRTVWSRSWGVRDAEAAESWVWPWTIFEVASLAKPVTSAATLRLAGTGALGLTEDLSVAGLRSAPGLFRPRGGAGDAPEAGSGVTPYLLLSHCAGLGFAKQLGDVGETGVQSFAAGARMPTLNQVITGTGPAGAEYRVVRLAPPGSRVIYSGVNHTLAQAVIEDRAPGGFLGHTRRFLAEIGMERSGYEQPMPAEIAREAAYGHRRGRKEPHEARPAAGTDGLWSTAEDLADFVRMLNQRGSVDGRPVLQPQLVDAMLGRDPALDRLCVDRSMESAKMALGVLVDRAGSRDELFWHQGTHGGYRAYLFGLPGRSQGLAITMSAGARDAEPFARELLDAVAREYRLPRLPG